METILLVANIASDKSCAEILLSFFLKKKISELNFAFTDIIRGPNFKKSLYNFG